MLVTVDRDQGHSSPGSPGFCPGESGQGKLAGGASAFHSDIETPGLFFTSAHRSGTSFPISARILGVISVCICVPASINVE